MEPVDFFSSAYFTYHAIIVFVLGTIVGSFLNVCIYRIPARKSIVFPNSYCYRCGTAIDWYDNIPLLSYLYLRGRCRHCNSPISKRYFLIELLTGAIFVFAFSRIGYTWSTPIYLIFICYFIIGTFTDFDHWIIPDSISIGGFFIALLVALIVPSFHDDLIITKAGPFYGFYLASFLNGLVGGLGGFVLLYMIGYIGSIVFHKEAMGGGDVKLFALVGALFGWLNTLIVLALSSFIGAVVGLLLIALSKILNQKSASPESLPSIETTCTTLDDEEKAILSEALKKYDEISERQTLSRAIPFGPYIAAASIILIVYYNEIQDALHYIMIGRIYG